MLNARVSQSRLVSLRRGLATLSLVLVSPWLLAQSLTGNAHGKPVKPLTQSRLEIKTQANQMAAGIRAAEAALSPAELAIAQRIEVGQVACELGAFVRVTADARSPGYFDVEGKKFKFRMVPVVTSTGAIRLEDPRAQAVWLQLSNKSMLMSQKTGSRLADACVTKAQAEVAMAMIKSPLPGLLDAVPAVVPMAVPARVAPEPKLAAAAQPVQVAID